MKSHRTPPTTTEESQEANSFWGMPDIGWGNSDELMGMGKSMVAPTIGGPLGLLMSAAKYFSGGKEEEEDLSKILVPGTPGEAERIHEDGFNESRAQDEMDEMLEAYQSIQAGATPLSTHRTATLQMAVPIVTSSMAAKAKVGCFKMTLTPTTR